MSDTGIRMITVVPKFIDKQLITNWLPRIDRTLVQPWPIQTMPYMNIIPHVSIPKQIYDAISVFGKISNTDLLIYNKNAYSTPHIDSYSFSGANSWTATGILFITEPEEYVGGELKFNKLSMQLKPTVGTFVMFPAGEDTHEYQHSVSRIESGVREVLVFRFCR